MTDITDYSKYLTGQPREDDSLRTLLDGINSIIQTYLIDAALDIETQSSILTAIGQWLDWWGARFKFPRPFFPPDHFTTFGFEGNGVGFDQAPFATGGTSNQPVSDDLYRQWIIARGGALITDGTISSFNTIIDTVFGNDSHYIDHNDMSMTAFITSSFSSLAVQAILDSGVLPKPGGVRLNVLYNKEGKDFFGFEGSGGVGFDQAPFIDVF